MKRTEFLTIRKIVLFLFISMVGGSYSSTFAQNRNNLEVSQKENSIGSFRSFNNRDLTRLGTQNLLQSLRLLDPSLKISENNSLGSDPNRVPDIEIRGKSGVLEVKKRSERDPNQPLFVLDGFETTPEILFDLNINRVESVTLLKDAAATAIYGSRAANGVIIIETKNPMNGRLRLSYRGDFSVSTADLSDYNLMNAQEKLGFEAAAGLYDDLTENSWNQERLNNLFQKRKEAVESGVNSDWLSEPLRTGFTHKHNLYLDGGVKKLEYGAGFSYSDTQGVMKGSDRERLSGNIDLIYHPGKFRFSNKTTIGYTTTNNPSVSLSDFTSANPYYRKYNAAGGIDPYLYLSSLDETDPNYNASEMPLVNPLWNYSLNNYDYGHEFNFANNFMAEWFINNDLKASAKLGLFQTEIENKKRLSPQHTDFDNVADKGFYSSSKNKNFNYEGDVNLAYSHIFNQTHSLYATAGVNFYSKTYRTRSDQRVGISEREVSKPSDSDDFIWGPERPYNKMEIRSVGLYLNGGYSYKNRYQVDINYRSDNPSAIGSKETFHNSWSAGIGWNIHNEKFLANNNLFQLLKIRGSAGMLANENYDTFRAYSTYAASQFNTRWDLGFSGNDFWNHDMTWQEVENYSIGSDIIMFQNRLNVTVDWYQKRISPLLAYTTTPGPVGIKQLIRSEGELSTKGVEASVRFSPIYRPDKGIVWSVHKSLRSSKSNYRNIGNSLHRLNEEAQRDPWSTTRYHEGGAPGSIWTVPSLGVDPVSEHEIFLKKDGTLTYRYDPNDEILAGNSEPKFESFFGTNLYVKGFSFGIQFRYRLGAQIFNNTMYESENIGLSGINYNHDKQALGLYWLRSSRAELKRTHLSTKVEKSTRFVMDQNIISGETITIGYDFTQSFIKKLGLSTLTLQGTVNDFFHVSTEQCTRGVDYPFAQTFSISLSAIF